MDIREIASRAGVSRTTVSRYLNDGYVSKEKRERIRRVIQETGYVPSRHAQQLRTGKTDLVGVIMPKINSQSVARMVAGITSELSGQNYQTLLANTDNDEYSEVSFINLFSARNHVDGIILIATVLTPEHREAIEALSIPLVVLGQRLEGVPCVYQDDYAAMRDLCRLAFRNTRKPGYIGVFDQDIAAGHERLRGYLDACKEAGLTTSLETQKIVGFKADDGYFGAEEILHKVPDVDTLICATDDLAFGAMMCALEYGKSVPEDIQVAGVGDSLLSRIARPSLSTVHLHYKSAGMLAARMLLDLMRHGKSDKTDIVMDYEVYGRMSIR